MFVSISSKIRNSKLTPPHRWFKKTGKLGFFGLENQKK
jgi:hypothetical protein